MGTISGVMEQMNVASLGASIRTKDENVSSFNEILESKATDQQQTEPRKKNGIEHSAESKVKPKEGLHPEKVEEVASQLEELEEKMKELASSLQVDVEVVMASLMNFLQNGDMEALLSDLGMNQDEAASALLLVDNTLSDQLMTLKELTADLKEVIAAVDLLSQNQDKSLTESNPFKNVIDQFLSGQVEEDEAIKAPSISESSNQTSSDTREDAKGGESNKTVETQNPLLMSKLNTIESIQDRMNIQDVKTLDQLDRVEVVRQIVQQISARSMNEMTTMTIRLKPDHLGNLLFTVSNQKGVMSANFVAENQAVKEAIEANLFQLREAFEAQGIDVEHIEVSVADNEYFDQRKGQNEQHQQSKAGSKRIQSLLEQDEQGLDEVNEVEQKPVHKAQSMMVDYSV